VPDASRLLCRRSVLVVAALLPAILYYVGLFISAVKLEDEVLEGLKAHLMQPALVKEFIAEYHRALNAAAAEQNDARQGTERELAKVRQELRSLIEALKMGIRTSTVQEELERLERRQAELVALIKSPPASPVRLHPNLAEVYRQKVEHLREALNADGTRAQAAEILRSLVDEVRLVPTDSKLRIHLVGSLASLLALGQNKQPGLNEAGLQVKVVAGARYQRYLRLTEAWL
jgi:site-specific DNA recombinase